MTRIRRSGWVHALLTVIVTGGCTAADSKRHLGPGASGGPKQFSFGEQGSAPGQLDKPGGIAVDASGNIWVADTGNHRVQVFGPRGKHRLAFGRRGVGPGRFQRLDAIHLHGDDVYVTDPSEGRLQVFDRQGRFKRYVRFTGAKTRAPVAPIAVLVHRGELFVVDQRSGCIQVGDLQGRITRQIGTRGTGKEALLAPAFITVDGNGRLWVADAGNSRVQIFEQNGRHVASIGPRFDRRSYFSGELEGLACDGTNLCYVVDKRAGHVLAFDLRNQVRFYLGAGRGRGPAQLLSPAGLVLDAPRKRILVADRGNHRIQIYSTAGPRPSRFPGLERKVKNTKPFVIATLALNPSRAIRKLMPLAQLFGLALRDLGFTGGRVLVITDYTRLKQRLERETIHLLIGSGYASMLAATVGNFTPLVIGKKSGRWLYHSVIVVREDTGIRSIDELAGKTMASEDRYSTSSFILPRIILERAGLMVVAADALTVPANAVKIKFTQEDLSAVWWMTKRGVEGGFVADTDFAKIKNQVALRVLQRSQKIPRVIVSARATMDPKLRAAIVKLLGQLTAASHRVVLKPLKVSRFRPISADERRLVHDLKEVLK